MSASSAAATELAQKGAAAVAAAPDSATTANPTQLQTVAEQARLEADKSRQQADNERRAILAAVLDDLQWFYQQRILKRRALWTSAWNLALFGVITDHRNSILRLCSRKDWLTVSASSEGEFSELRLIQRDVLRYARAFFSRLISLQFTSEMTVEDAENRYGPTSLLIRAAVGMCRAAVIYFLLGTELLGNTLKPSFTEKLPFIPKKITPMLSPTPVNVLMPSADWCLLIMWSFLVGFSERLVPDSLARAEGQVSGKPKQP